MNAGAQQFNATIASASGTQNQNQNLSRRKQKIKGNASFRNPTGLMCSVDFDGPSSLNTGGELDAYLALCNDGAGM